LLVQENLTRIGRIADSPAIRLDDVEQFGASQVVHESVSEKGLLGWGDGPEKT
jgi:hypothetical protein